MVKPESKLSQGTHKPLVWECWRSCQVRRMNRRILALLVVVLLAGCIQQTRTLTGPAKDSEAIRSPITSTLDFAFEEANGELLLKLRTQEEYGCCNFDIVASLVHPDPKTLLVDIDGVDQYSYCLTIVGPATAHIPLGALEGEYQLVFNYQGRKDTYSLSATSSQLALAIWGVPALAQADHLLWRRLPVRTVWLVVHDPVAYVGNGEWRRLERPVYEEQKQQFFNDLQKLSVKQFTPEEGHYTNHLGTGHRSRHWWTHITPPKTSAFITTGQKILNSGHDTRPTRQGTHRPLVASSNLALAVRRAAI
jgi:hypothetical protein